MSEIGLEQITETDASGRRRTLIGMPVEKAIAWALRLALVGLLGNGTLQVGGIRGDLQQVRAELAAVKVEFRAAMDVLQEERRRADRLEERYQGGETRMSSLERRVERVEARR